MSVVVTTHSHQAGRPLTRAVVLLAAALLLTGCAGDKPKTRTGCLPFPGPVTLFSSADPDNLGKHCYGMLPNASLGEWETQRGIVYTCRAGFLDVAHIRAASDWTRYCSERVRTALAEGERSVRIGGADSTAYEVRFAYPAGWSSLGERERSRLIDDISLRLGQRLSYAMMTFHEIATWYGYRPTIFVSEAASAFTYEDVPSHVVGLYVAEAALRDAQRDYDEAVTVALNAELARLEVIPESEIETAIWSVREIWWSRGKPIKRLLNDGLHEGAVTPWLVRGLDLCPQTSPEPLPLPSLADVRAPAGMDLARFATIRLKPGMFEAGSMREDLVHHWESPARQGAAPLTRNDFEWLDAERDLPVLVGVVREAFEREVGLHVSEPWSAEDEAKFASMWGADGTVTVPAAWREE